jgi:hypothetical protein
MSKHNEQRKATGPADKTQAGDPIPNASTSRALTPEELAGKANLSRQLPQQTGPRAMAKKCGWCGEVLPVTAVYCPHCVPEGKPIQFNGGTNLGQWRVPTEKR